MINEETDSVVYHYYWYFINSIVNVFTSQSSVTVIKDNWFHIVYEIALTTDWYKKNYHTTQAIRFGASKVNQMDTKWDKSGTFIVQKYCLKSKTVLVWFST